MTRSKAEIQFSKLVNDLFCEEWKKAEKRIKRISKELECLECHDTISMHLTRQFFYNLRRMAELASRQDPKL